MGGTASARRLPVADDNDDRMFGLTDDELDRRFAEAVRLANEAKIAMGVPLPKFDASTRRAYLLYADGSREYVGAS
jgi:hypothetical protein